MGEGNIKLHKWVFFRVKFNMYEKAKSCLQHRRLLIIFNVTLDLTRRKFITDPVCTVRE